MENVSPTAKIILGIIGVLFVIPGIAYFSVEKSYEYTGEVNPKTLGNVSYPPLSSDSVGGKKKNKSRKLRR